MITLDVRRGPGLAHEALDGIRVLQYFLMGEFDSDSRVQVNVMGGPDNAHAATPESSLDAISSIENIPFMHVDRWFNHFRRYDVADPSPRGKHGTTGTRGSIGFPMRACRL